MVFDRISGVMMVSLSPLHEKTVISVGVLNTFFISSSCIPCIRSGVVAIARLHHFIVLLLSLFVGQIVGERSVPLASDPFIEQRLNIFAQMGYDRLLCVCLHPHIDGRINP